MQTYQAPAIIREGKYIMITLPSGAVKMLDAFTFEFIMDIIVIGKPRKG